MIYLLASLQIRHDPSVHADPGRIFLHLQKQMSYLWVSTAHNRSYQDATTITKAERINIAIKMSLYCVIVQVQVQERFLNSNSN